jgi:hypothetical protein
VKLIAASDTNLKLRAAFFEAGTVTYGYQPKGVCMIPTTLTLFLSVRKGAGAVEFYKSAFGAEELLSATKTPTPPSTAP